MLSHVQLFVTPWTVAHQVPQSLGILRARILEWVAMPSSGDLPKPGIEPRSPMLQEDSLPSKSPGKSMDTRVVSLSLPQGIFLTQESNWGLLHCKQILYQLSYQESPLYSLDLTYLTKDHLSCGEGNGNPLQYSCLENPMDRAAW